MNVHFACTACGACCNTPPSIYLNELLEQSEHFIFFPLIYPGNKARKSDKWMGEALAERTGVDPRLHPGDFEKSVQNHLVECATHSADLPGGKNMSFRIMLNGLEYFRRLPCPQRGAAGQCEHYEGRPLSCRTTPLHPFLTGVYRGRHVDTVVRKRQLTHDYKCDLSEEAPLLVKDGQIMDEEMKAAWTACRKGRPEDDMNLLRKATLATYLSVRRVWKVTDRHLWDLMTNDWDRRPGLAFGLSFVLLAALRTGFYTRAEALQICENQIRQLDIMIAQMDDSAPMILDLSEGSSLKDELVFERDSLQMIIRTHTQRTPAEVEA